MAKETMRTHVILPRDVVEKVDRLVGRRGRSKFLAEAAEEKMARLRLLSAARQAAGALAEVDIPGWETSESAAEWVSALRSADEDRSPEPPEES